MRRGQVPISTSSQFFKVCDTGWEVKKHEYEKTSMLTVFTFKRYFLAVNVYQGKGGKLLEFPKNYENLSSSTMQSKLEKSIFCISDVPSSRSILKVISIPAVALKLAV